MKLKNKVEVITGGNWLLRKTIEFGTKDAFKALDTVEERLSEILNELGRDEQWIL